MSIFTDRDTSRRAFLKKTAIAGTALFLTACKEQAVSPTAPQLLPNHNATPAEQLDEATQVPTNGTRADTTPKQSIKTPISAVSPSPVREISTSPTVRGLPTVDRKFVIHMGSISIDQKPFKQEIDDVIGVLVDNVPNATHIAIGTYLDYDKEA
jgi:hypothetical protein